MNILRLALFLTCAAAFSAVAAPNTTILSAFKGNYRGRCSVDVPPGKFSGRTRVRGVAPASGLSLKLILKGSVSFNGYEVRIDNEFQFTKKGKVKVKTTAPGTGYTNKSTGTYTATGTSIAFEGTWKQPQFNATGTFEGTVTRRGRQIVVQYTAVVDDSGTTFSYTYKGK